MIPLFNFIFQVTLTPDQAIDPTQGIANISTFVQGLFPTMVKVIAAMAVLSIAYWGIRYMYSNVPGFEKVSKERIWKTLLGLLLALSAYFILNIINPNIVGSLDRLIK